MSLDNLSAADLAALKEVADADRKILADLARVVADLGKPKPQPKHRRYRLVDGEAVEVHVTDGPTPIAESVRVVHGDSGEPGTDDIEPAPAGHDELARATPSRFGDIFGSFEG
jgi:hypothetical protein